MPNLQLPTPNAACSLEVGNWKLGGIYLKGPTYDHEGRSHEAHEDKPLRRRNPNAFNWLAVGSDARTPDRVINPVVRIGPRPILTTGLMTRSGVRASPPTANQLNAFGFLRLSGLSS